VRVTSTNIAIIRYLFQTSRNQQKKKKKMGIKMKMKKHQITIDSTRNRHDSIVAFELKFTKAITYHRVDNSKTQENQRYYGNDRAESHRSYFFY